MELTPTFIRLFEENILKEKDCWYYIDIDRRFQKEINRGMKRIITVNGKRMCVHRVSYLIYKGEIGNFNVVHTCKNTACVNPEHLILKTRVETVHLHKRKDKKYRVDRRDMLVLMKKDRENGMSIAEMSEKWKLDCDVIYKLIT